MNIFNKNMETDKEFYQVLCTECGRPVGKRFFPLNTLMQQYHNGTAKVEHKAELFSVLKIGAYYGEACLPDVVPLVNNGELAIPERSQLDRVCGKATGDVVCFECGDKELSDDGLYHQMQPVPLNISAIIAQFYYMTSFYEIYRLIQYHWDKLNRMQNGIYDLEEDAQSREQWEARTVQMGLDVDAFYNLPFVTIKGMSTQEGRIKQVEKILRHVIDWAKREDELRKLEANRRCFAVEDLFYGWRYETINQRRMPKALVFFAKNGDIHQANKCCCDKCFAPIPLRQGAYRQRIVGLLGTQSTGKSTYLAALADAIDKGEVTMQKHGNKQLPAQISIKACIGDDIQWSRAKRDPESGEAKAGILWLYQHGFPPEKTEVNSMDAAALTFLVSKRDSCEEPIMYTLADISGEAFHNAVSEKYAPEVVATQHRLLFSCDALFVIVSSRQLYRAKAYQAENGTGSHSMDYVNNPQEILTCYQTFLPKKTVPTAIILTSSDEINGGNLRLPMQTAYDPKKVSPLIWSERDQVMLYNAERMSNIINAVRGYLNRSFGDFMGVLKNILKEQSGSADVQLAAFAVSNGTQCAPQYFGDLDADKSVKGMSDRYEAVRQARFGIEAPLLWLLACDDVLDVGYCEPGLEMYSEKERKEIKEELRRQIRI